MTVLLGLAIAAAGCSDPEEDNAATWAIADRPLSGKVLGEDWTFSSGEALADATADHEFYADAYTDPIRACEDLPDGLGLMLDLPPEPGDYVMRSDDLMIFIDFSGTEQRQGARGRLVIDAVTPTQITGGATIKLDANNSISGRFVFTICG
jgi:hypothetical protein